MSEAVAEGRAGGELRTFNTIWAGQVISALGSGLTGFGLGVWVYEHTGSVTQFAVTILATALPSLVVAPLAGAFVDRHDRRTLMITADVGAGLCTMLLALLFITGQLRLWNICAIMAVVSILNVLRNLAFSTLITLLVPKESFGKANGRVQLGPAAAQIASPLLAGALLGVVGLPGLLLIDFTTFTFALGTLLAAHVPRPVPGPRREGGLKALAREAAYGWSYIAERPGLMRLLAFFAVFNFNVAFSVVLFTPLLLSITSVGVVGVVASVAGSGLLLGSILMSFWGGPKRRVHGILGFGLVVALGMMAAGAGPSVPLIAAANFAILFSAPIVNGCSQALWQSKTAPDVQGRVFAVRMMVAWSTTPLAYLVAGPLSDKVLGPMLVPGGALAGSVGRVIGVGAGRGIGLLLLGAGAAAVVVVACGFLSPRLRLLEDELPDTVVAPPPPAAVPAAAATRNAG
jgi:DHA3 family macrolide efflux protein-like MFS transporter